MYINLLIKLKNAQHADKKVVKSFYSTFDHAISDVLVKLGFLSRVEVKGRSPKKYLELELNESKPILGMRILSKPSRRVYSGYRDIRRVKGGYGSLVLSTPKGVIASSSAFKEKVGGQKLFEIW